MQNRLRHLENLVKDVMNAQAPVNNTGSSDCAPLNGIANNNTGFKPDLQGQAQVQSQIPGTVTGSPMTTMNAVASGPSGQLIQSAKETTYVGATHWAAILEDVSLPHFRQQSSVSRDSWLINSDRGSQKLLQ